MAFDPSTARLYTEAPAAPKPAGFDPTSARPAPAAPAAPARPGIFNRAVNAAVAKAATIGGALSDAADIVTAPSSTAPTPPPMPAAPSVAPPVAPAAPSAPVAPAPGTGGIGSEFLQGLEAGAGGQNVSMLGGAMEAGGVLVDDAVPILGRALRSGGQKLQDYGTEVTPTPQVGSIADVPGDGVMDTLSRFGKFAAFSAGSGIGTSLPSLAIGGAAGLATANPMVGFIAGAIGPSYIQNLGDVYTSASSDPEITAAVQSGQVTEEQVAKTAALAAVPIAALDAIGLEKTLGAAFKPAKDALRQRIMRGIATGAISEGSTEGLQNIVSQWAQSTLGQHKDLSDRMIEVVDNVLGGVFAGGLMGGVAGIGDTPTAPRGATNKPGREGEYISPAPAGTPRLADPNRVIEASAAGQLIPVEGIVNRARAVEPTAPVAPALLTGENGPTTNIEVDEQPNITADAARRPREPLATEAGYTLTEALDEARRNAPPANNIDVQEGVDLTGVRGVEELELALPPDGIEVEEIDAPRTTDTAPDINSSSAAETPAESMPAPDIQPDNEIDIAAHEAATSPQNDLPEPTDAQKKAGNYKKGHVSFQGNDIAIENPVGSKRSGTDPSGKPWSVDMSAHYGYVKRTTGADGDQVDVYLPDQADESAPVHVFDQYNPDTGEFDEHKAVLGVASREEAERIYDAHFSDGTGPKRRHAVTTMSADEFKQWAREGDTKKPAREAAASASAQPDYEQRHRDRVKVAASAKREADLEGIVQSEYADNERHFEGTRRVERAVEDARGRIKQEAINAEHQARRNELESIVAGIEAGKPDPEGIRKITKAVRDAEGLAGMGGDSFAEIERMRDRDSDVQELRKLLDRAQSAEQPAIAGNSGAPLTVETYTDKSIIVRGDTRTHKDRIKAIGGALWNKKAGGWIFKASKRADVEKGLADLLGKPTEEVPLLVPKKVPENPAPEPQAGPKVVASYDRLREIAKNIGVSVDEVGTGFHTRNGAVSIPTEDTSPEMMAAVSAKHVFAHELGHAIMQKRGISYAGFPAAELRKQIANWDELVEASRAFRPGVWSHPNSKVKLHARKPNEVIADAIATVLLNNDGDLTLLRDLPLNSYDLGYKVSEKPADKPEPRVIGKNHRGQDVYEDANGVRSYSDSGVRVEESVQMRPTRDGMRSSVDVENRKREFKTMDERKGEQLSEQVAAANRDLPKGFEIREERFGGQNAISLYRDDSDRAIVHGLSATDAGIQEAVRQAIRAAAPAEQPAPATDDDLSAMFDDVLAEELSARGQPAKKPQTPQVAPITGMAPLGVKPPAAPRERTAGQSLASAGKNTAEGLSAAIKGLGELFGGKGGRLNSGLSFDEETYAKAKPLFIQAVRNLKDAASDLREAMRTIIRMVLDQFGAETADGMKPYVVRFVGDVKAGAINLNEGSDDGIQDGLPGGDEAEQSEGVQPPGEDGGTGDAATGEDDGSVPDAGGTAGGRAARGKRGTSGRKGRARSGATSASDADQLPGGNYRIAPGALEEGRGPAQKARDNVRSIELAREIEAEGRPATLAEQHELALYVGWGGLSGAFPDGTGAYGKGFETIGPKVRELLNDTEYATAQRSIQYAHYTSEPVIRAMWDAASLLGFKGGKVFEPGMGIGHFAGLMPADIAERTAYTGLELDHTTARIARLLYPKWGVRQDDFTKAPLPENMNDLVIGNPPFADIAIKSDPKYATHSFLLHDYFFAKSLDSVRPGGLLMFISSAGTMNKNDTAARQYLADRADLVGAIRLPSSAFKENAGTEVTTDIIIMRKRLPGEEPAGQPFVDVAKVTLPDKFGNMKDGNISSYFAAHPEMVLGEQGFFDKLYAGRYAVRPTPGAHLPDQLSGAIARLPEDVMSDWTDTHGHDDIDFASEERKEGSYYLDKDGRLMQHAEGVGRPVERRGKGVEGGKSADEIERIKGLIPIRDALRAVYAADLGGDTVNADRARERLNTTYDDYVKAFGPINKSNLSYRRPNRIQVESARDEAREEARYSGLPFDEGSFDPSSMSKAGKSLAEIAKARADAREAALTAGNLWDEGTFNPDDMPDIVIDKRPNIDPFSDDQESYRLRAIERYDESTGIATKGLVFAESVITKEKKPEINSAGDAMLYVLNKYGYPDIEEIAKAARITRDDVLTQLGNSLFEVPGAPGTYETSEDYLSGNVRVKLAEAQAAARNDDRYRKNLQALLAAQPIDLPPSQISATLGMPWIPADDIVEFATEALGLEDITVKYVPKLAEWVVTGNLTNAAATATFGTARVPGPKVLHYALNRVPIKVFDSGRNPDGSTYNILNTTETEGALLKLQEVKDKFAAWIYGDETRAERLAALYNEKYNNLRPWEGDGSYLTTPGVSAEWGWRPHQLRVIARILRMGNTYMGHAVGAGKTSAMIGAAMEMRRLGLVRKPMISVPNHMLGQFTKEFYEQYPTAKIMVADERRFHTSRRKQFIAEVANQDLDAVIITHSAMGKIPVSNEFQDRIIQEQIDSYREIQDELGKKEWNEEPEKRLTRKRVEKAIERLEQRLSGRMKGGRKDQVFTFEEMGVDFLFVDEAHLFRKLDFATRMSGVKGISPEGSQQSMDLYVKARYLRSQNPTRHMVLASGTPITNTMAELYSVSRYIQEDELEARGLAAFDAWAAAFGDTVTEVEQDAAGGYKAQTRFAQFVNVPELSAMVRQAMDVVTSSDLAQYVTRPTIKGGKRRLMLAERSEALEAYQQELAGRMRAIENRKGPPQKGDDILLSVINDGRLAAIDMRLVNPSAGRSNPPSKLDMLVNDVYRVWKETVAQPLHKAGPDGYSKKPTDYGPATQMIFANLGIGDGRPFNVAKYIVSELVSRGVPRAEVALIADYNTHVARQKLFNDMNEGKVRVLIGSTAKMATGVNAQRRLFRINNLDPLWYPADDEQRIGRALRQGNMNPEIEINDYSTKGTYDSQMWSLMAKKARFIEGFFRGDPTMRTMEDLGESSQYEQAKAMTTNDPRLIELTNLKQDLERGIRRRDAFESETYNAKRRVQYAQSNIASANKDIARLEGYIAQRIDTSGENFFGQLGDTLYKDRAEFGKAMWELRKEMAAAKETVKAKKVGEFGGFSLALNVSLEEEMVRDADGQLVSDARGAIKTQKVWGAWLFLQLDKDNTIFARGNGALAQVATLEDALGDFEAAINRDRRAIADGEKDVREFTPRMQAKFEGQAAIDEVFAKLKALENALAEESKAAKLALAAQAEAAAPDEGDPGTKYAARQSTGAPERGLSASGLHDYLARTYGGGAIRNLLRTGKLKIVAANDPSLPQDAKNAMRDGRRIYGLYDEATDTTFLVHDNLTDAGQRVGDLEDGAAIFLHELGVHYGMPDFLGQDQFNLIKKQLRLAAKANSSELGVAARAAYAQVPASTRADHIDEEALAWLVTDRANHKLGLVKRILMKIRAWLVKHGFKNVTSPDELVELARGAVNHASGERLRAGGDTKFAALDVTSTEAFKRWFGDSKAVNEFTGEPLVLYHGTTASFDEFNPNMNPFEPGVFLTPDRAFATFFTQASYGEMARGGNIMPVYARLTNPMVVDFEGRQFPYETGVGDIIARAKKAGHDGVILRDVVEGEAIYPDDEPNPGAGTDQFIVFSPEQVKSATGNRGTFDASNSDIRYAARDATNTPAFKRWFGNSKVVNRKGEPLMVFHGTKAEFDEFRPTIYGERFHFGTKIQANARVGMSPLAIQMYKKRPHEHQTGTNIMPVYLSIQNPVKLPDMDSWPSADQWRKRYKKIPGDLQDGILALTDDDDVNGRFTFMKAVIAFLESKGYDGIVYQNQHEGAGIGGGGKSWMAFHPEQIKSATGNNGTFDGNNPSILYAARDPGQPVEDSPALEQSLIQRARQRFEPWLDAFRYEAQDKFHYLKKAQQEAADARELPELPESEDAYLAELRYHGMAGAAIEDFQRDHVDPMLKAIQDAGLDIGRVDEFLHARHAKEANAQLRKINPTADELEERIAEAAETGDFVLAARLANHKPYEGDNAALSGMSNAEAREVMAKARADGKFDALEDVGRRVDEITAARRNLLVASGLEKRGTIAAWENAYEHYVPLKREGKGDALPRRGRGYDTRGKEKRRAGSTRAVEHILANVVAQHEATLMRAEKAKVGRAMMTFAVKNPNPELYEVNKVDYQPSFDAQGLVTYRPQPGMVMAENVFVVRVRGEDHRITFNDANPDAMKIAAAIKNLGAEESGPIINTLSKITRILSLVNTGANPEFIISNFARDIQTAGYNLSGTDADALKWQIIGDVGKAWKGIRAFQKKQGGAWADKFDEFRKAGAQTGWMDHYRDINDREKALVAKVRDMEGGGWPRVKRGLSAIWKFIEDENTAVENAIRLSAFVHARDMGMTEAQAARLAKELTVNFNRRGAMGKTLNALYMFYNASIQGQVRIISAIAKSRKVQGLVVATMIGAALLDIWNRSVGDDDDDKPNPYDAEAMKQVKDRNLVFMLPGGDYVKIPLPWGYNVFHVLGQTMGEMMTKPGAKPTEAAVRVAGSIVDAFNPIGGSVSLLQMISPTVVDPIAQWYENKDFAGRPLRPSGNPFGPAKPESQQYWSSVRPYSKWITEKLNAIDGDEVRPGTIDFSPEAIDLMIDTVFGGAGRFVADTIGAPWKRFAQGEKLETYEVPVLRKVYGSAGPAQITQDYYKHRDAVALTSSQLSHYKTDAVKLRDIRQKYAEELRMIPIMKATESQLKKLREMKKLTKDRARQRELEDRMHQVMARFNERYYKVVTRAAD